MLFFPLKFLFICQHSFLRLRQQSTDRISLKSTRMTESYEKRNINILKLEIYKLHNCFRVNYPLEIFKRFTRAKVQKFIGSIFMFFYRLKNSQCLAERNQFVDTFNRIAINFMWILLCFLLLAVKRIFNVCIFSSVHEFLCILRRLRDRREILSQFSIKT